MTKQFKVGDVVEVVEATGHSANLGSTGVVEEVYENGSFWVKIYEKGWGNVYGQTMMPENVKLLTRDGELMQVTGSNRPKHYLPVGTTVEVIGVSSPISYESFEEVGVSVKVKLPATKDSLIQYVNVYDLSEVDTVKDNSKVKEDPLRYLDEGTLILFTDDSDNIRLATFVGIEEGSMFTVDTQPSDTWEGFETVPNHRFEDSLGFSIGDTVMYIGEPSFNHQLEEGDVMTVLGIDEDGDLILDTSKLEHVTQSEQYLYDELCLDLNLVDKASLDDGSVSEFKAGDIVRISDTDCLNFKVKVGDTAEVEELGHLITVKMISGVIEGQRQYVDDYQLELVGEESPEKVLFKKGDVIKVTNNKEYSNLVGVGDVAKVEGVDNDGDYILKFIGEDSLDGLVQYTDGKDIKLLVKSPEVNPKFEVGDIVTIKSDTIFNDKVLVGDKAVITGNDFKLLMITGDYKGQPQVCFGDEDYASKYLELVRN